MNEAGSGRRATTSSVILLVPDYVPALGGTTTQTRMHAAEFARRGWNVTVLTRRVGLGGSRDEVDGIAVRRIGPPRRGNLAKAMVMVGFWFWLLRRRRAIDLVSVVMDADFAVSAWAAGLASSSVLTWATRGDATRFLKGPRAGFRRHALRRCDQVVLTEDMGAELAELGFPASEVIAVPVDIDRFQVPGDAVRRAARTSLGLEDMPVVVSIGHLQERKGTDRLLEAVRLLRDRGTRVTLVLVGGPVEPEDHAYVSALQAFVHSASLEHEVRFAGAQDDVVPYLCAADLFCLASHREGMPNVLLEAMASGVPCIAPASAGGDRLLAGGAGLIPPSNSPGDLADAIEHLLADPDERCRMRRLALDRVRRSHTIVGIIDAYERLAAHPGRDRTEDGGRSPDAPHRGAHAPEV